MKKPVDEPEPQGSRQSLQERHTGQEDQRTSPVGQEALQCSPQEEDGHPHPGGVPGLDPGLEPVVQNIPGLKEVGSPQEEDDHQGLPPLPPLQEEGREEEGQGGQASQDSQEEGLGQGLSTLFGVQDKVADDDPLQAQGGDGSEEGRHGQGVGVEAEAPGAEPPADQDHQHQGAPSPNETVRQKPARVCRRPLNLLGEERQGSGHPHSLPPTTRERYSTREALCGEGGGTSPR